VALPSTVTLGGLALIVAAGAGLGVVATTAGRHDDTTKTSAPTTKPSTPPDRGPTQHPGHSPDPVPKTLVEVYNNSGVHGLAARRASFLQGAGWNVAATDNWYGDIPADTVYFPPRQRDAAEALARTLDITRLHRAVAPMQFDRLTVILTSAS
jgi:hypothetical protein